jgi:putative hydroxymethylpyrimidine transport system substrate-binding protein
MKLVYGLLALGVAAVLLAGCGEGGSAETTDKRPPKPAKPQPLSITIDGYFGPENVGILMADKRGYFEDAGLEVAIFSPVIPRRPATYLSEGVVDLAVSHEPQIVLAKEKGAPIMAVASLVPHPTATMIWLKKSGIDGIADLKGKTVAIPGLPFQEDFLASVLGRAGLTLDDVKVEDAGYEVVPALVGGRADAIFGGSWNVEGAELETRGLEPVVTRVQSLGIPDYEELVLAASRYRLSEDPQLIRAFVAAVSRGTAAAIEDPRAATNVILEGEGNEKASRKAIAAGVEATLPLLSKTGQMDPEQAGRLVDWMREEGLVERALPPSALLTNRYLSR